MANGARQRLLGSAAKGGLVRFMFDHIRLLTTLNAPFVIAAYTLVPHTVGDFAGHIPVPPAYCRSTF